MSDKWGIKLLQYKCFARHIIESFIYQSDINKFTVGGRSLYKIDETWKFKTEDWVHAVALSKDGQEIVIGSSDLNIYLFKKNGELKWKKDVESSVMCCEFSNDNNYMVFGLHSGSILFMDKKGQVIWKNYAKKEITSISISKDGKYIVAGSEDKNIYFFNNKGKLLWKHKTNSAISEVNISQESNSIVAGSHDDQIYVFNFKGDIIWDYNLGSWVNSTNINIDGNYVVAGSQNKRLCYFNNKGKLIWDFKTHNPINIVMISNNGENVISCNDNHLELYDNNGRKLWRYEITDKIECASFSNNGKFIVVGSRNKNFYYFNIKGELLWSYLTKGVIHSIDISSDGDLVIAGSDDYFAYFFNLKQFYGSFIKNAENAIKNAKKFGTEIKDSESLLTDSKLLLDKKLYEESMILAIQAKNSAVRKQKLSRPEILVNIAELENVKSADWNYIKIKLENIGNAHAKNVSLKLSGPMKVKNLEKNFDLSVGEKKELNPIVKLTINVSHFKIRGNGFYNDADGREYSFPCSVDIKFDNYDDKKDRFSKKEESGEVSYFQYKYVTKKRELKICPFCTSKFKKEHAIIVGEIVRCPKCNSRLQ